MIKSRAQSVMTRGIAFLCRSAASTFFRSLLFCACTRKQFGRAPSSNRVEMVSDPQTFATVARVKRRRSNSLLRGVHFRNWSSSCSHEGMSSSVLICCKVVVSSSAAERRRMLLSLQGFGAITRADYVIATLESSCSLGARLAASAAPKSTRDRLAVITSSTAYAWLWANRRLSLLLLVCKNGNWEAILPFLPRKARQMRPEGESQDTSAIARLTKLRNKP